jgi:hypothetical protein
MKRKRVYAAVGAGVAAAALLAATPAGATRLPSRIIEIDPTSGPVGTTVTVSGGECAGEAYYGLFKGTGWRDGLLLTADTAEPDDEGAWSGELVVPEDVLFDQTMTVEPGTDYFVGAACVPYDHRPGDVREGLTYDDLVDVFDWIKVRTNHKLDLYPYKPVPFEVTEPAAEPPAEEPAAPEAPPAVPVVTEPTYTG